MLLPLFLSFLVNVVLSTARAGEPLKVAIIGTDTSHAIAFTTLMNSENAIGPLADVQVVVAYPGGSSDIPSSRDRVMDFSKQLAEAGIAIVDSPEEAVADVDAILLESVDGRAHLDQFRRIAMGKPVFIDKPAAASVADFLEIMRIAEETNTPFFSSSALRFCPEVDLVTKSNKTGNVLGAATSTPFQLEPHHPDLFWYGIHGIEALSALLGPGCETVARHDSKIGALIVGCWSDGRQGATWALSTKGAVYSFTVYGDKTVASKTGFSGYDNLVNEICKFFVSRIPPISPRITLEILAIMEAADESRDQEGIPISISSIINRARKKNLDDPNTITSAPTK
ncbi:hypothetical protein Pr1d_35740 [Bythopirellula goksoeyrii]|uniref:Oxidoreductase family, NAD-binding Rossmann fold n=2 Tax=Bythopirellula goksoeyrii TaxID=1400387 RepID=A0A5B9QFD7_9BACT|nr:hypothetical protein Pr1d_35740 [Bythopirellula goksoeyrii]